MDCITQLDVEEFLRQWEPKVRVASTTWARNLRLDYDQMQDLSQDFRIDLIRLAQAVNEGRVVVEKSTLKNYITRMFTNTALTQANKRTNWKNKITSLITDLSNIKSVEVQDGNIMQLEDLCPVEPYQQSDTALAAVREELTEFDRAVFDVYMSDTPSQGQVSEMLNISRHYLDGARARIAQALVRHGIAHVRLSKTLSKTQDKVRRRVVPYKSSRSSGVRLSIIKFFLDNGNAPADAHKIATATRFSRSVVQSNINTLPPLGILEVVGHIKEPHYPKRSVFRLKAGWQDKVNRKIRIALENSEQAA